MANAVAAVETEAPAAKKGPSMVVQLGVLVVLTLVAAGIGFFSGGMVKPPASPAPAAATGASHGEEAAAHGEMASDNGEGEEGAVSTNPLILSLPPLTTNLAAPPNTWARMELDVILDEPAKDPHLAEIIHQDLLAYMRTVKLHQVDGASGLRHLKSDMEERARARSDGHVRMVLIKTLIFE